MVDPKPTPTLIEATSWLRDAASRRRQILDVVERNSVIAGLPKFTDEVSQRIRTMLSAMTSYDNPSKST